MADAGRILIIPKGDYDANSTYDKLDLVKYKGTSWLAKKVTAGNEPSEGEYWQNMFGINIANNLTTTEEGQALDARQGKVLNEKITEAKNDLSFEDWKRATLLEGWTGNLSYAKNNIGQARLRFVLGTGANVTEGTMIAVLPYGYNPMYTLPIPTFKANLSPYNSLLGLIITSAGEIIIRSPLSEQLVPNISDATLCGEITYWIA